MEQPRKQPQALPLWGVHTKATFTTAAADCVAITSTAGASARGPLCVSMCVNTYNNIM